MYSEAAALIASAAADIESAIVRTVAALKRFMSAGSRLWRRSEALHRRPDVRLDLHAFREGIERRVVVDDAKNFEDIAIGVPGMLHDGGAVFDHVAAPARHRDAESGPPLIVGRERAIGHERALL